LQANHTPSASVLFTPPTGKAEVGSNGCGSEADVLAGLAALVVPAKANRAASQRRWFLVWPSKLGGQPCRVAGVG
jgi:hypothetical protein